MADGPDAGWDFLNCHLYGPFALLDGRAGFDIDPAQLQTFFPPWAGSSVPSGPIYGMENPGGKPGMADRTLAYYGLRRGPGRTWVRSHLDHDGTLVCPLERDVE
jgi:hypothetical protein